MKEKQFEVKYQYIQEDKSLEDVFTYLFDEIQKLINTKQSEKKEFYQTINKYENA